MEIRGYRDSDVPVLRKLWNDILAGGVSFPGEILLTEEEMRALLLAQTATVCACIGGEVAGFFILHPNNIGRCSHVANASYGVSAAFRGRGLGTRLVEESLAAARSHGFRGLQFNAVVAGNTVALGIYDRLGFVTVGTIPGGFRLPDGAYSDMFILYHGL